MSNNLGEVIRKARIEKGLSKMKLEMESGITCYQIRSIESGRTKRPHFSTLRVLAQALDLDVEELFKIVATCRKKKIQNSIGEVIREARIEKGLSQMKLAEVTGIAHVHIANIERGAIKTPHNSTLEILAQPLDLDAEELFKMRAICKKERNISREQSWKL